MTVDITGTPGQANAPATPAQANEQPKDQANGSRKFSDDEAAALLKENMANKAKLKKIEDAEAKRIEDAKKANGEFQSLLESEKAKNTKLETTLKDSMLKLAAKNAGLDDLDYLALIDQNKITYGENFAPIGIAEAIEDLKARKPALFATVNTSVPKTPIPSKVGNAVGPSTFDEFMAMPMESRKAYMEKHHDAYEQLVKKAKGL